MPAAGTGYWASEADPKVKKDIVEMLQDPTLTYAEIGRGFGVEAYMVQSLARIVSAPERTHSRARKVLTERPVECRYDDLSSVDAEIEAMTRKLEELKQKRAEMQLRFEDDGGDIVILGVGAVPLRATSRQWMQFLQLEGPRKLREFITRRER